MTHAVQRVRCVRMTRRPSRAPTSTALASRVFLNLERVHARRLSSPIGGRGAACGRREDGGTGTGGGPHHDYKHLARVLHDRRHRLGRDWCARSRNTRSPALRRPQLVALGIRPEAPAPPRAPARARRTGGLLGAALGPVFYAFETSNPAYADLPLRQQLRIAGRDIAARSRTWGRNFGVLGGLFSVSECFVAKVRGRSRARRLAPALRTDACLLIAPARDAAPTPFVPAENRRARRMTSGTLSSAAASRAAGSPRAAARRRVHLDALVLPRSRSRSRPRASASTAEGTNEWPAAWLSRLGSNELMLLSAASARQLPSGSEE